jgi:hypothetical protein
MREYKGFRKGNYLSIAQVCALLNPRIGDVISYLRLHGQRKGDSLWIKNPTRNDHNPSLQIRLSGAEVGKWKDQATDDRGDALALIRYIGNYSSNEEPKKIALQLLGIDENNPPTELPQVKVRDQEMRDEYNDVQENAWAKDFFFHKCTPEVLGSPVDDYLKHRGINLRQLPRIPDSLRYCPEAYSTEASKNYPAMVWLFRNKDGLITGSHTTFLENIGGIYRKAKLKVAKRMNGTTRFSFISLGRGETGKSLTQPNHGERLMICEGIETGLSLVLAFPKERVLAAGSVSNIKNIRLPADIKDVSICMDNDGDNAPTLKAYRAAADAFRKAGKSVFRFLPQHNFNDFNDWLTADKAAISAYISGAASGEGGNDDVPF